MVVETNVFVIPPLKHNIFYLYNCEYGQILSILTPKATNW